MIAELDSLVSITVQLAGRVYPLTIKVGQEAVVRSIAKELNEKVAQYQMRFPGKDKMDCLIMATLSWAADFATKTQAEALQNNDSETSLYAEMEDAKLALAEQTTDWQNRLGYLHTLLDCALQH